MKIDQIAFYCQTEEAEKIIKATFGLTDESKWTKDKAISTNVIYPLHGNAYHCRAIGELQFNYDLGIELEILRYTTGSSWHNHLPTMIALRGSMLPFLSHVGIHLDDGENFPDETFMNESRCWRLVQETTTHQHTNPYLLKKRRTYQYKIYESVPGTYIKYIKRHEPK